MSEQQKFVFNYSKYKTKKIDLKMLDDLMETVIAPGTSKFATIVAAIKILLFFAYLWARKRLIDEQFLIEQQQNYEQGRVNENDDVLDNDDLDTSVEEDNLD